MEQRVYSYSNMVEGLVAKMAGKATGSREKGQYTSDLQLEYRYCTCVTKNNLLCTCYHGGKISVNVDRLFPPYPHPG